MSKWFVPLAAAVVFIFYLMNAPVIIAVSLRPEGIGVGFGAFLFGGAAKRAQSSRFHRTPGGAGIGFQGAKRLISFLLRRVKVEYIGVSGSVALSDAMHTALLTGALHAAGGALGKRADVRVLPDFSSGRMHLEGLGIVSVKLGHSICAAILYAAVKRKGRKANGQASD